jgi:protein ImuB
MDFDGPVESLEAIWLVFKNLIGEVVSELQKRGRGARTVLVEFYRPYAVTLHQTIRLSRAGRDPVNLFNLLRCATETMETDVGFLGIQLSVMHSERVSDEQIALLEHEQYTGEIELGHLIERLSVRLGERAVARPTLVESHVPERAYTWHAFSTRASDSRVENPCHERVARPLHLFPTPEEIRVIVTPSNDMEGFPVSFTSGDGTVRRLAHAIGPERIAGQWWHGHDKTRDYFEVEDAQTGERFWVFRVLETRRWFLHGEFE